MGIGRFSLGLVAAVCLCACDQSVLAPVGYGNDYDPEIKYIQWRQSEVQSHFEESYPGEWQSDCASHASFTIVFKKDMTGDLTRRSFHDRDCTVPRTEKTRSFKYAALYAFQNKMGTLCYDISLVFPSVESEISKSQFQFCADKAGHIRALEHDIRVFENHNEVHKYQFGPMHDISPAGVK